MSAETDLLLTLPGLPNIGAEALRVEVAILQERLKVAQQQTTDALSILGAGEVLQRANDVLVQQTEARAERLAGALRNSRHAGALLANIAYNLAQDESLSEPVRWSLDDARKRWDLTTKEARAALEQENES